MDTSNHGSTGKVVVAVRVRKLIERERNSKVRKQWRTNGNVVQQVLPENTVTSAAGSGTHTFDHVFGENAPTRELYERVVKPVVSKSLEGFNGTVLCYGQTSSGKTHTLYGTDLDPGLISMMAQDLFHRIRSNSDRLYYIKLGLLEIYNEKMSDLLNNSQPVEDVEVDGVVVPKDLKTIEVFSPEDIFEAAQQIQEQRKTGETQMNTNSSRSHTILRIVIESVPRECNNNDDQLISAVLNFVDLAGSEKSSQTGATGDRLQEAKYINKSLSSLCKVVMELSKSGGNNGIGTIKKSDWSLKKSTSSTTVQVNGNNSVPAPSRKIKYINFRDSKLTRILQSSLNGSAFVVMICNLTPACFEESLSTLRFAKTAKDIKIDPTQNTKYLTTTDEYQIKILELEALLRKKSTEIDELHSHIHVMQTFHKVCSPAPVRAAKAATNRRISMFAGATRTLDPEDEPQVSNKDKKTIEMPLEEISKLKRDQLSLNEENERLKKKLKEAEAAAEKNRLSKASAVKVMKEMRLAMEQTVHSMESLKKDNASLRKSKEQLEMEKKTVVEDLQAELRSARQTFREAQAKSSQALQLSEQKLRQVQNSKTYKMTRAVQTVSTSSVTVSVQTPDHIEPIKYINELKTYARRKEQELVVTKDYYEKTLGKMTKEVIHLQNEVRRKSAENLLTEI